MTQTTEHTLYAAPFTCSLAVHLALRQRGIPFSIHWVRRGPGQLIADEGFAAVNPKRKVATLVLPSGEVLTENVGILLHIEQEHGPPRTAAPHRRLVEWLTFIATELHKQVLAPTFDPETPAATIEHAHTRLLPPVLAHLEATLLDRETLLGEPEPSAADAYLFWGLLLLRFRWPESVATPGLHAFRKRMLAKPFTATALALEQEVREAAGA